MSTLDNILSGQGDAVSEQTAVEENVAQVEQTEGDPAEESVQLEEPSGDGEGRQGFVPQQALHAEKQKVKRYTEQVGEFEKTLGTVREQNAALTRQVTELLQRIPQQKTEQQQPPDQFEDFPGATRHVVQPEFQRIEQQLLAIAKDTAITRFTEEKVNEAEQAFISAMQSQKLDPADFQKVVHSPNRYAAAVQWHQRHLAQAEIGDDPAAFKAKVEAELREKIKAELQQGDGQQTLERTAPVMPSNFSGVRNAGSRSGPAWSGPPSLNDIFSMERPATGG